MPKFALCIDSSQYPASLQKGKIYFIIPDEKANSLGMIRIIDESEEDYLYNSNYFESIALSPKLEKTLKKIYSII